MAEIINNDFVLETGCVVKKFRMMEFVVRNLDDSTQNIQILHNSTGADLFVMIVNRLKILESDYFDLLYDGLDSNKFWLDHSKLLSRQFDLHRETPLRFCVKFYVPHPNLLEDAYTRYLFALQIKNDLFTKKLRCSETTMALISSYIVQAEVGDFIEERCASLKYLKSVEVLNKLSDETLAIIREFHKNHVGMTAIDSDYALLDTARKVEFYGIRFHQARDRDNLFINLAVSYAGVMVFKGYTKINTFCWEKIRKLSFKRRKFILKLHNSECDTVYFNFDQRENCKKFWKKCIENHAFFRCSSVSRNAKVVTKGSSYRYVGRTQKELIEYARRNISSRPPFERPTLPTRRMKAKLQSSYNKRFASASMTLRSKSADRRSKNTTSSLQSVNPAFCTVRKRSKTLDRDNQIDYDQNKEHTESHRPMGTSGYSTMVGSSGKNDDSRQNGSSPQEINHDYETTKETADPKIPIDSLVENIEPVEITNNVPIQDLSSSSIEKVHLPLLDIFSPANSLPDNMQNLTLQSRTDRLINSQGEETEELIKLLAQQYRKSREDVTEQTVNFDEISLKKDSTEFSGMKFGMQLEEIKTPEETLFNTPFKQKQVNEDEFDLKTEECARSNHSLKNLTHSLDRVSHGEREKVLSDDGNTNDAFSTRSKALSRNASSNFGEAIFGSDGHPSFDAQSPFDMSTLDMTKMSKSDINKSFKSIPSIKSNEDKKSLAEKKSLVKSNNTLNQSGRIVAIDVWSSTEFDCGANKLFIDESNLIQLHQEPKKESSSNLHKTPPKQVPTDTLPAKLKKDIQIKSPDISQNSFSKSIPNDVNLVGSHQSRSIMETILKGKLCKKTKKNKSKSKSTPESKPTQEVDPLNHHKGVSNTDRNQTNQAMTIQEQGYVQQQMQPQPIPTNYINHQQQMQPQAASNQSIFYRGQDGLLYSYPIPSQSIGFDVTNLISQLSQMNPNNNVNQSQSLQQQNQLYQPLAMPLPIQEMKPINNPQMKLKKEKKKERHQSKESTQEVLTSPKAHYYSSKSSNFMLYDDLGFGATHGHTKTQHQSSQVKPVKSHHHGYNRMMNLAEKIPMQYPEEYSCNPTTEEGKIMHHSNVNSAKNQQHLCSKHRSRVEKDMKSFICKLNSSKPIPSTNSRSTSTKDDIARPKSSRSHLHHHPGCSHSKNKTSHEKESLNEPQRSPKFHPPTKKIRKTDPQHELSQTEELEAFEAIKKELFKTSRIYEKERSYKPDNSTKRRHQIKAQYLDSASDSDSINDINYGKNISTHSSIGALSLASKSDKFDDSFFDGQSTRDNSSIPSSRDGLDIIDHISSPDLEFKDHIFNRSNSYKKSLEKSKVVDSATQAIDAKSSDKSKTRSRSENSRKSKSNHDESLKLSSRSLRKSRHAKEKLLNEGNEVDCDSLTLEALEKQQQLLETELKKQQDLALKLERARNRTLELLEQKKKVEEENREREKEAAASTQNDTRVELVDRAISVANLREHLQSNSENAVAVETDDIIYQNSHFCQQQSNANNQLYEELIKVNESNPQESKQDKIKEEDRDDSKHRKCKNKHHHHHRHHRHEREKSSKSDPDREQRDDIGEESNSCDRHRHHRHKSHHRHYSDLDLRSNNEEKEDDPERKHRRHKHHHHKRHHCSHRKDREDSSKSINKDSENNSMNVKTDALRTEVNEELSAIVQPEEIVLKASQEEEETLTPRIDCERVDQLNLLEFSRKIDPVIEEEEMSPVKEKAEIIDLTLVENQPVADCVKEAIIDEVKETETVAPEEVVEIESIEQVEEENSENIKSILKLIQIENELEKAQPEATHQAEEFHLEEQLCLRVERSSPHNLQMPVITQLDDEGGNSQSNSLEVIIPQASVVEDFDLLQSTSTYEITHAKESPLYVNLTDEMKFASESPPVLIREDAIPINITTVVVSNDLTETPQSACNGDNDERISLKEESELTCVEGAQTIASVIEKEDSKEEGFCRTSTPIVIDDDIKSSGPPSSFTADENVENDSKPEKTGDLMKKALESISSSQILERALDEIRSHYTGSNQEEADAESVWEDENKLYHENIEGKAFSNPLFCDKSGSDHSTLNDEIKVCEIKGESSSVTLEEDQLLLIREEHILEKNKDSYGNSSSSDSTDEGSEEIEPFPPPPANIYLENEVVNSLWNRSPSQSQAGCSFLSTTGTRVLENLPELPEMEENYRDSSYNCTNQSLLNSEENLTVKVNQPPETVQAPLSQEEESSENDYEIVKRPDE